MSIDILSSSSSSVKNKDEDFFVLTAMEKFGGSFVKSLAKAARLADSENYAKLKTAFPEIWHDYESFVDDVRNLRMM